MKTQEFSAIAVKLAGIVCLIVVLFRLQNLVSYLRYYFNVMAEGQQSDQVTASVEITVYSGVFSFLIIALAGLFLIFAGDRIGRFITPSDSELPLPQSSEAVFRIGIALVGVWVMAVAIPDLISASIAGVLRDRASQGYPQIETESVLPELIGALAKTVIGAGLFFGARGVVGIHTFVREAGKRRISQQEKD